MKEYPTINYWNKGFFGESCYAFEKIDGSNIRTEWSKTRGFYKFGSKTQIIDETDSLFGEAVILFRNKYGADLDKLFRKHYREEQRITVFFEYFGKHSFAGWHNKDEPHDVTVFDILTEKGFVPPKEFIKVFGNEIEIPNLYYKGAYTRELVHQVKASNLDEGVVIKGLHKRKIWMVKAKSNKWFDRLRALKGELELLKEINGDKTVL